LRAKTKLSLAVASDHGGFAFKEKLKTWLKENGLRFTDFGTDSPDSCDYPDFGLPAAKSVSERKHDLGILVCNNGIGMSILANKITGIKAALVYSESSAQATKEHHNSNILCLGGQEFTHEKLLRFVELWLKSEFQGGRHQKRINLVDSI
jgi:ribose 5-phosphate isomerase B